jgi:hypothetical protein
LSGQFTSLMKDLGLARRVKVPSLAQYMAERDQAAASLAAPGTAGTTTAS